MKKWLPAFVAVMFGLPAAYGQPLDPLEAGPGMGLPFEEGGGFEEGPGIGGPESPPAPPWQGKEGGKRKARLRGLKEKLRAVRAELDLLNREISGCVSRMRDLKEELSVAEGEEERARIKVQIQEVLDKLSQYEILLAEKKVEISKKAYELALDRYIKAEVELEGARRKSKFRGKWLKERPQKEPGPLPHPRGQPPPGPPPIEGGEAEPPLGPGPPPPE